MPRMTKAHKELEQITFDLIYGDNTDAADDLISSIISHLPHKDAKAFADLWRSDSEEDEDCSQSGW